jgi:hypothetical protein
MRDFPAELLAYSRAELRDHRVPWWPTPFWQQAFANNQALADELVSEAAKHGGIRRAFVHGLAAGDPVDLFLATMAWGFGARGPRFPAQQNMVLGAGAARGQLTAIISATQVQGAGAGWNALLNANRAAGLDMSYGTKLLYFAGYCSGTPRPWPLILDSRVRRSLVRLSPGVVPATGLVQQQHYVAYLEQAAAWAADPRWNESPEVVEYALFSLR